MQFGRVRNHEVALLRRDRSVIYVLENSVVIRDETGQPLEYRAVVLDITEMKHVQSQLQRQHETLQAKLVDTEKMAAVGQLVSGVAHEVNNPLTAIMGFADLLLENPELTSDIKDHLRVIVHESQRTREIVQNLLNFARQTVPNRQPVNVNDILRRTIALRSYDMSSHGIQFSEHFDSGLPEIVADAHQLQQVFLNILNNACDAVCETQRRGKIVVSTEAAASSVDVRFSDNGTGISNPDRIFEPFYTTKDVGKGTGLGLSICYEIVREHSGEIVCFNNQDAPGATFTIRLPSAQPATAKQRRLPVSRIAIGELTRG